MPTERLTQCPHCKASFKVSEEQLNVANGRVRCGSCMNIFDAVAYSIPTADNLNKQTAPTSPHSSESPLVDLEDSILEPKKSNEELFQDDPDEDKKEQGYSGSSRFNDELSSSFLELDESLDTAKNNPYATSIQEIDLVENNSEDESWTDGILEDMHTEASDRIEPHVSDSSPTKAAKQPKPENDSFDSQEIISTTTDDENEAYTNYNFYHQDDNTKGRHWLLSTLLFLSILILTVTLLAQASWLHYEKLSQHPKIAMLYKTACVHLQCQLPTLSDIKKIKSDNLIVRSHPTTPKALIIDATIINNASFQQDFPNIALYFSDINNQTIAQRLISPKEYLSDEILSWNNMPPEQPIHISLEIIDPGKEAVNYSIKFFSAAPTTSNDRSNVNQKEQNITK
jgi:predicted Zn finger-like uncharacterized protein